MATNQRRTYFWPLLVAAVLMVCALAVYKGIGQLSQAQAELDRIQTTNLVLRDKNQALYGQVERLRSDDRALEKTIRQEMGMVRQDEVIYLDTSSTRAGKEKTP